MGLTPSRVEAAAAAADAAASTGASAFPDRVLTGMVVGGVGVVATSSDAEGAFPLSTPISDVSGGHAGRLRALLVPVELSVELVVSLVPWRMFVTCSSWSGLWRKAVTPRERIVPSS